MGSKSYCVKCEMVGAVVNGDLMMMHPVSGEYFAVRGSGQRIWELLAKPITFDEIVRVVCLEYEVDSKTCIQDTSTFVSTLVDLNLVNEV